MIFRLTQKRRIGSYMNLDLQFMSLIASECFWPLSRPYGLAMQARNIYSQRGSDSFQLSQQEIWASALSLIESHALDAIGMASV